MWKSTFTAANHAICPTIVCKSERPDSSQSCLFLFRVCIVRALLVNMRLYDQGDFFGLVVAVMTSFRSVLGLRPWTLLCGGLGDIPGLVPTMLIVFRSMLG